MKGALRSGRIGLAAALAMLLSPGAALAHASDRGHVLLLPTGHYLVGGAAAVAASFLVLALVRADWLLRLAAWRIAIVDVSRAPVALTSLFSFLFLLVLLFAGAFGSRDPLSNPLPLVIWTLLWVGLTMVQGLLGNVWRWVNPWYFPWLMTSRRLFAGRAKLSAAWGYWPAVVLFAAFAWFELIEPAPDDASRLGVAVTVYFVIALSGMLIFGFEEWSARGEFLSAFYRLIARFAVFAEDPTEDGRTRSLSLRLPGARIAKTDPLPISGVFFILLALGSVSFDGFSKTFFWLGLNDVNPLEFPGRTALVGTNTIGLALTVAALALLFCVAVWLGDRLAGGVSTARALGMLVWSIIPIALAYHAAHYLTALLVNGQYALRALSDPFGSGWDILGTADLEVHPGIAAGSAAAWLLWNLQAAIIVVGHVMAVLVAHLQAHRLHGDDRAATLSQAPLTLLMIAYTVFGLWLLSTPTVG